MLFYAGLQAANTLSVCVCVCAKFTAILILTHNLKSKKSCLVTVTLEAAMCKAFHLFVASADKLKYICN